MLFPVPLHMSNAIAAGEGGDKFLTVWAMWLVPHNIFELGVNPFFTDSIFYPIGTDLYTTSLTIILGILSYPIQIIFGEIFTYNLLLLIAFTLSGWATYVLAHWFTKNSLSSFFAGFVFTFSAFHLAHASGHFHLMFIFCIPFFVLYLFKLKDESKISYGFLAGIFLVISVYVSDLQVSFYLGLFTIFF